jgi:hypothetical protein
MKYESEPPIFQVCPLNRPSESKKPPQRAAEGVFSGHIGSRTPNLLIRSQMLYPIELCNRFPVLGVQR